MFTHHCARHRILESPLELSVGGIASSFSQERDQDGAQLPENRFWSGFNGRFVVNGRTVSTLETAGDGFDPEERFKVREKLCDRTVVFSGHCTPSLSAASLLVGAAAVDVRRRNRFGQFYGAGAERASSVLICVELALAFLLDCRRRLSSIAAGRRQDLRASLDSEMTHAALKMGILFVAISCYLSISCLIDLLSVKFLSQSSRKFASWKGVQGWQLWQHSWSTKNSYMY